MDTPKHHKMMSFNSLFLLLSSLLHALEINGMMRNEMFLDPTTILKTIESDYGEIIDCVDIYKQPAFNHPQLKNHTLQMKPSSRPFELKVNDSSRSNKSWEVNFQSWHKNGEYYCPEGTIPILRSSNDDLPQKKSHPMSSHTNSFAPTGYKAEYAVAFLPGSNFQGASADINVWNPITFPKELSASQLWVTDGGGKDIDSVEAGWMVTAFTNHPTLFVYWTRDGYGATGCYNLRCPGFIQTNRKIALGAKINPVSTYAGDQFQITVSIFRDNSNGNWYFSLHGDDIGYWPVGLFNGGLRRSASLLEWGGEVINSNPQGLHTSTDMGSGHLPYEGNGKAAWFKKLKYIDGQSNLLAQLRAMQPDLVATTYKPTNLMRILLLIFTTVVLAFPLLVNRLEHEGNDTQIKQTNSMSSPVVHTLMHVQ